MIEEPEPFRTLGEGSIWDQVEEIAGDISKESPIVLDWLEQAEESCGNEQQYSELVASLQQSYPKKFDHFLSFEQSISGSMKESFPSWFMVQILSANGYLIDLDWKEHYHSSTLMLLSDLFKRYGLEEIPKALILEFDEKLQAIEDNNRTKFFDQCFQRLVEQRGYKTIFFDQGDDRVMTG